MNCKFNSNKFYNAARIYIFVRRCRYPLTIYINPFIVKFAAATIIFALKLFLLLCLIRPYCVAGTMKLNILLFTLEI